MTTTYTLDEAGRRLTATTDGASPSTLTRHYNDPSDNPSWTEKTAGGTTTTTRYAASLGGDLAATITGAGAVQLPLTNMHGDTVTTVDVPSTGAATSINAWSDYDEYGNARTPTSVDAVGGPTGYAWLGADERGSDDTGLILMGARLYNPLTGEFTSADPVYGGNETAYTYPGDPINETDVSGLASSWSYYYSLPDRCGNAGCTMGDGLCRVSSDATVCSLHWKVVPNPSEYYVQNVTWDADVFINGGKMANCCHKGNVPGWYQFHSSIGNGKKGFGKWQWQRGGRKDPILNLQYGDLVRIVIKGVGHEGDRTVRYRDEVVWYVG